MKKTLLLATLAVALVGGATFAVAYDKSGDCTGRYCKMFDKKDANSDGVISKAEFVTHAEKKFAKMDSDGNGKITKEEVKSYWNAKKEKRRKESGQCGGK